MSKRFTRRVGAGIGLAALFAALPALAADLAYPPYPGEEPGPSQVYREERVEEVPPPPRPAYGPRFVGGPYAAVPPPEECRTIVKRRIDEYGGEIERRIRICDEPVVPPGPRLRPSFYRPPPIPPVGIPDGGWAGSPRW